MVEYPKKLTFVLGEARLPAGSGPLSQWAAAHVRSKVDQVKQVDIGYTWDDQCSSKRKEQERDGEQQPAQPCLMAGAVMSRVRVRSARTLLLGVQMKVALIGRFLVIAQLAVVRVH